MRWRSNWETPLQWCCMLVVHMTFVHACVCLHSSRPLAVRLARQCAGMKEWNPPPTTSYQLYRALAACRRLQASGEVSKRATIIAVTLASAGEPPRHSPTLARSNLSLGKLCQVPCVQFIGCFTHTHTHELGSFEPAQARHIGFPNSLSTLRSLPPSNGTVGAEYPASSASVGAPHSSNSSSP